MPCPICNQVQCDHTPAERSQTPQQMIDIMMADLKAGKNPASKKKKRGKNGTYKITVAHPFEFNKMVEAGNYGLVSEGITEKYFQINGCGQQEIELFLVHLEHKAPIEEILGLMKKKGLSESNKIEHLLALGATYPKLQEKFPIVVLCKFLGPNYGANVYPFLYMDSLSGRSLFLNKFKADHIWEAGVRFLAIAEQKNSAKEKKPGAENK